MNIQKMYEITAVRYMNLHIGIILGYGIGRLVGGPIEFLMISIEKSDIYCLSLLIFFILSFVSLWLKETYSEYF